MKAILEYQCDFCGFRGTKQEVFRHEAEHYGLTPEEYAEWDRLDTAVKKASHLMGGMKNERTEADLDRAVEAVLAFEKAHGLEGRRVIRA